MEIAIHEIERQEKYKLLIGCIVPRPIAWVTSLAEGGIVNAAPFSYFNVASIEPMMVSVAVMRKPGSVPKDTARNIMQTGEFVVNMVDVHNVDAVNQTSADYPPQISEVEALGLEVAPSVRVKVPRLRASRIHFECKLHQIVELGSPTTSDLIIGEVVHVHVVDELYHAGRIDATAFAPVSRLAGHTYATLGEQFDRPRPVYEPPVK
ncbi:flavin reductase family protein [Brevibacillus sp. M2.1A]|uniref:flavin reductase family protein n=1 Tax=Brevibacillus TaxID=55080 RepID=UPI00156B7B47|nr:MULTISPECIES: flavin reductase family protein [Brevibacillus]MBY0088029.1 flavin reductase family protein [Brevibacillus brevis]MCC8437400.1 flavin reductase family protein [Brevibacillus sp. M2.1A]MCE0450896.1 flavin reductase family protein [Brevibacillus sp. AF8]MCM3145275.1 flavin reductase family protein [Brevibacillus sp. MER 51]UKK99537.1 flavin reductase family protein [Brevibacillus brevis]